MDGPRARLAADQRRAASPVPGGSDRAMADGDRDTPIWRAPDLRVETSRSARLTEVAVFARGPGDSVWRAPDRHRIVLSLDDLGTAEVRMNGGRAVAVRAAPRFVGVHPAGVTVEAAHRGGRVIQVTQSPALHASVAAEAAGLDAAGPEPGTFPCDPLTGELMRALAAEVARGPGPADALLVDALSAALAVQVARLRLGPVAATARDPGGLSRERLRRVLDHVEAHLADELTLADLAGVACLSPYHFSRCFKRATGEGVHRHVVRRRVERAKTLLRDPDGPTLADVALAVGFADQSHFTAAFRRETGTTPGRYRAEATGRG